MTRTAAILACCLLVLTAALPAFCAQGDVIEAEPSHRSVTLTGYTRARYVMDMVSEVDGRTEKVLAEKGESLGKGGLFAVLDTTFIDLDIKRNLAEQKIAESSLDLYSKEVARYERLVSDDLHDQSTLDKLLDRKNQAAHTLERLKAAEADLRARRQRHFIRAHEGWKVISRDVEPGRWVNVGTTVGRAGDYSSLLVPFALTPEEYGLLKSIKEIELVLPLEPGGPKRVAARIERVSPGFDEQTRKIGVDLAVDAGPAEMRGGLRAELTLDKPEPDGVVMVPGEAVLERYEEHWLVRESGEKLRVFLLGPGDAGMVRVRAEGLSPGQRFRLRPEI